MKRQQHLLFASILFVAAYAAAGSPIRFASYNASLNFSSQGEIRSQLAGGQLERAQKVAAVIQHMRPDVLLLNEFDFDPSGEALDHFRRRYLAVSQFGQEPIVYDHAYLSEVNTGVSTEVDIDRDGEVTVPQDAHAFGRFPGQFGMVLLSRYPIDENRIRTFGKFLWADMPGALFPIAEDGESWYTDAARERLRLSSKNHWDIPVSLDDHRQIHVLASHPTPPVFDGPEDRNGRRNFDEIRFWKDYLDGADYIYDDRQSDHPLADDAHFMIMGDLNADPIDGDGVAGAMDQLLLHARVQARPAPASHGGVEASARQAGANANHQGNPAHDTGDFNDNAPGNLRLDYVLPDVGLEVAGAGVFWPTQGELGFEWIDASDHRMVWVDVK